MNGPESLITGVSVVARRNNVQVCLSYPRHLQQMELEMKWRMGKEEEGYWLGKWMQKLVAADLLREHHPSISVSFSSFETTKPKQVREKLFPAFP